MTIDFNRTSACLPRELFRYHPEKSENDYKLPYTSAIVRENVEQCVPTQDKPPLPGLDRKILKLIVPTHANFNNVPYVRYDVTLGEWTQLHSSYEPSRP